MSTSYLNDAFFARLESLTLALRPDLSGFFGGKHLVKTYGQTVEFADYREYVLGDDIRRIDWNLYSRFEKHYIKLFTDERQMHTQIFIDCSASMGQDDRQKSSYAIGVAAALGYLSVHNMDKVSFRLLQGDKSQNPFGTIVGKHAFFRAIRQLENMEFDGESQISDAVLSIGDTGGSDGLTVIISDFFTDSDWKSAVDYLIYKKRQVLLIQVMTPEELEPTYTGRYQLIDKESSSLMDSRNMRIKIDRSFQEAYEMALKNMLEDLRSFCHTRGAQFITVNTAKPIEEMLFKELLKVGIMA